jgi:hypothetical protein
MGTYSVTPQALEPRGRQLGVAHGVLDVAMAEIRLQRARVGTLVGKLTRLPLSARSPTARWPQSAYSGGLTVVVGNERCSAGAVRHGSCPPCRWEGGQKALHPRGARFRGGAGFPPEFSVSPSQRRPAELSVSGPMPLGDLHDYQAEIIDNLAPIIASRGSVSAQGGDGVKQLEAMPKWVTPSSFRFSCVRLGRFVYLVLAERCLILFEAQASEPCSDIHGRALLCRPERVSRPTRPTTAVRTGIGKMTGHLPLASPPVHFPSSAKRTSGFG